MTPYLSDSEILDVCRPLTQPAAMIRYLKDQGFHIKRRPNGWPLLSRTNFEAVMMGHAQPTTTKTSTAAEPNVQALLDRYKQKGASYADGKNAQKQPAGTTR